MPTLKQLICEVEWGNTGSPFPEYNTTYGDGVVETYIAIPDHPQPFAVRLRSRKYIAEGLAMLVFMDGDYQCNRNRLNLRPARSGDHSRSTEIDIRVRQKEKSLGNGTYIGRAWRFDKHNIVPLDHLPANLDRQHFKDLGTISVYVLRCRAKEEVECKSSTSSDVDDYVLETPETANEAPTGGHRLSDRTNPQVPESVTEPLLGFMVDGAGGCPRFGLDGEGPSPTEHTAWSWNIPHPPFSLGSGPPNGYVPGQPPPAPAWSYGSYGHPPGISQPWLPEPVLNQDRPAGPRPQRHVHFNDQIPPQPPGHGASDRQNTGAPFSRNTFPPREREYPQQSGSDGNPPPNGAPHQVSGGISTAADHGRFIPHAPDSVYRHPLSSYQPVGYGASGFTGWPLAVNHHAYAQPAGPPQPMAVPSYVTAQPYLTATYQPQPYPLFHSAYSGAPGAHTASVPPIGSYPGGGIWGPPPPKTGSQDPAKDENNQLDGQSRQSQENTGNVSSQANDNTSLGMGNDNTNRAATADSNWNSKEAGGAKTDDWNNSDAWGAQQNDWNNNDTCGGQSNSWNANDAGAGQSNNWNANDAGGGQSNSCNANDTGGGQSNNWNANDAGEGQSNNWNANDAGGGQSNNWNANDAGGGQTNNWNTNDTGGSRTDNWNNNTTTHTEAPANDLNQSAAHPGHANDAGTTWHLAANTSAQVQQPWSTGPIIQPNEVPYTYLQSPLSASISIVGRPLIGPHGPYYGCLDTNAECEVQPDAGEEPPYDVPSDMPTTHQVKPGEGYVYVHKRRSPEYLDSLDEPYARFVFKYRTKEQIENETGIKFGGDEERRMLQGMDKDEIIDMLLNAKVALGGQVPSPAPKPSGNTSHGAEPIVIPAPAYSFLGYDIPTARRANNVCAPSGNVGLGTSATAPAPTAANTANAPGWYGNSGWANNNAAAAAAAAAAAIPGQPNTWVPPAAAPPPPQQWTHMPAPPSAPTQPQPQPQAAQPPAQQAQPTIPPIQFNPNVQTYQPPPPIVAPPLPTGANARPVTPPGGWNAPHTARSSSASDNGMAGWNQQGGDARPDQPSGGW